MCIVSINIYIYSIYINECLPIFYTVEYKWPTTPERSSFDVINILAIFSHGIAFEKTSWQRGNLNLLRQNQSTALLSTLPSSMMVEWIARRLTDNR